MSTLLQCVWGKALCARAFSFRRRVHRSLLLVVLLCGMAGLGFAQQSKNFAPVFYAGIGGGASANMVYFFPAVKQYPLMDGMGGVIFGVDVESFAGLRVEVNYIRRGWKERFDAKRSLHYSKTLSYVELPLMSHFYIPFGGVKLLFNLGPQFGFRLSEQTSRSADGFSDTELKKMEQRTIGQFAWGITAGSGLSLSLGRVGTIELEARGYFNFSSIYPTTQRDIYGRANEFGGYAKINYLYRL